MDQAIFTEILRLRRTNFDVFRTDISMTPRSPRVYAFTFNSDSEVTVPIKLENTNKSTQSTEFVVEISYRFWIPLEQFLVISSPPMLPIDHQTLMDGFWQHTGKAFRLLDLPSEIRNCIYKHALFDTSSNKSYRLKPRYNMSKKWVAQQRGHGSFRPNITLLRASRQVGGECQHLLYTDGEFHFTRPEDCNTFFLNIGDEAVRSVRRLDLRFSHLGFLRFFGARVASPELVFVAAPTLDIIKLKTEEGGWEWIRLDMPHPGDVARNAFLCDKDFPCPKRVVDWVLDSAFVWLDGIDPSKVFLGGCIKEIQYERFASRMWRNEAWRRWWEEFCYEVDHEKLVDTDGGVGLEGQEVESGFCAGSDEEVADDSSARPHIVPDEMYVEGLVPPMCECTTTCSLSDFTKKD